MNPGPLSGTTVGILNDGEADMAQTVATVPGDVYQLQFGIRLVDLLAPNFPLEGDPGNIADLNIFWEGQKVETLFVENRTNWLTYTIDFEATQTSSTVGFTVPQSATPFIDDIALVEVPDKTGTFTSLLFGFSACVMLRRFLQPSMAKTH